MSVMEGLTLKQKEQARLATMNRVLEKKLTLKDAALFLGLSERQAWRLLSAYRKEGARAFVHGNRGIRVADLVRKTHHNGFNCFLPKIFLSNCGKGTSVFVFHIKTMPYSNLNMQTILCTD
jgi:hypothetical protein